MAAAAQIGDRVVITEGIHHGRVGVVAAIIRIRDAMILSVLLDGIPQAVNYVASAVKPFGMVR